MSNLVSVPWQPGFKLTPDTLAYLVAASNRLGTQLELTDAWRSYAEQKYYWDAYQAGWGNPASNPDTGQRNHMRGAAFDLERTDAAAQAACRAVGLVRDGVEAWHWNNPNWANMPIIKVDTSPAGYNAVELNEPVVVVEPFRELKERAMGLYTRIGSGQGEGQIYFQEKPTDPLYPLDGTQWAAAEANGAKYTDQDAQVVQALMRKVGFLTLDPKYKRLILNADGTPKVTLPG